MIFYFLVSTSDTLALTSAAYACPVIFAQFNTSQASNNYPYTVGGYLLHLQVGNKFIHYESAMVAKSICLHHRLCPPWWT